MSSPETSPKESRAWHMPTLDGVRAMAILSVTAGHALVTNAHSALLVFLGTSLGAFGVSMFFVLSGFLITTLLLREEAATNAVDVAGFYGRRFLRIFPAYFGFIAFVLALDRLHFIDRVTLHDYIASAFFARNLTGHAFETGHLWSLSLEEQFYLLWPTAIVLTAGRARARLIVSALVAFALWRVMVLWRGWYAYGALYQRTDLRLDTILTGCLLAIAGAEKFSVPRRRPMVAILSIALCIGLSGAGVVWQKWAGVTYPLLNLLLFTALAAAVTDRAWLCALLSAPVLRFIGRISYSLYLWQQIFLAPAAGPLALVRSFPVNLALAALASLASYYCVEKPIVRWKNAWADRRALRPVRTA